jgi:hypothetical protein
MTDCWRKRVWESNAFTKLNKLCHSVTSWLVLGKFYVRISARMYANQTSGFCLFCGSSKQIMQLERTNCYCYSAIVTLLVTARRSYQCLHFVQIAALCYWDEVQCLATALRAAVISFQLLKVRIFCSFYSCQFLVETVARFMLMPS